MVQGMAEHILNRGVISNLARFCPEADLIVACQHGSQRGPLLPASAIRAVTRDLLIQTFGRVLHFVHTMSNADVRVDVYPRHLPEGSKSSITSACGALAAGLSTSGTR